MNRLEYLLSRWKHNISLALFIRYNEFKSTLKYLGNSFKNTSNIVCSFYIPYERDNASYYIKADRSRVYFPEKLYPMNILRNIAIEQIVTSHFLYIDIDFFISGNISTEISKQ